MPQPHDWARAWAIARPKTDPMLRQGAWYPVVNHGSTFVMLDVRERYVMVPKHLVELRDARPEKFTVVYRGSGERNPAQGTGSDLGRKYAVCPSCANRVRLLGQPEFIHCYHCGHHGVVAWWETG